MFVVWVANICVRASVCVMRTIWAINQCHKWVATQCPSSSTCAAIKLDDVSTCSSRQSEALVHSLSLSHRSVISVITFNWCFWWNTHTLGGDAQHAVGWFIPRSHNLWSIVLTANVPGHASDHVRRGARFKHRLLGCRRCTNSVLSSNQWAVAATSRALHAPSPTTTTITTITTFPPSLPTSLSTLITHSPEIRWDW